MSRYGLRGEADLRLVQKLFLLSESDRLATWFLKGVDGGFLDFALGGAHALPGLLALEATSLIRCHFGHGQLPAVAFVAGPEHPFARERGHLEWS